LLASFGLGLVWVWFELGTTPQVVNQRWRDANAKLDKWIGPKVSVTMTSLAPPYSLHAVI
jgi:hypothetical protein